MCLPAFVPLAAAIGAAATSSVAPTVLAGAGLAATAIGGVTSVLAANEAAEFNAEASDLQAADAIARGQLEESTFRAGVSQEIGAARASFGASGVRVESGSPAEALASQVTIGNLDAMTIRRNALREAGAFRTAGELSRSSITSPLLGVGGSLLTGASELLN